MCGEVVKREDLRRKLDMAKQQRVTLTRESDKDSKSYVEVAGKYTYDSINVFTSSKAPEALETQERRLLNSQRDRLD